VRAVLPPAARSPRSDRTRPPLPGRAAPSAGASKWHADCSAESGLVSLPEPPMNVVPPMYDPNELARLIARERQPSAAPPPPPAG
jgi:hypothetical protein